MATAKCHITIRGRIFHDLAMTPRSVVIVPVKGDARNQYIEPIRWLKPGDADP
jgi:hypothetical protein